MIRYIRLLVIALVAIILVLFVVANQHRVIVSFDPFSSTDDAAFSVEMPLFVVMIGAAMLGIVAGAAATWVAQGRHRRAARHNRNEAKRLRAETQTLKDTLKATQPPALPRA
jgi:uncharacterized integral membrane protein